MSADALPTSTTVARWSAWLRSSLTGLDAGVLGRSLIASWLLRACAPIDAAVNVSTTGDASGPCCSAGPAPDPDRPAQGVPRQRRGQRQDAQRRARHPAGRSSEEDGTVQACRAAAAPRGRPLGEEGSRPAQGMLAARPRCAGLPSLRARANCARHGQGRPNLLRRQRHRIARADDGRWPWDLALQGPDHRELRRQRNAGHAAAGRPLHRLATGHLGRHGSWPAGG